MEKAKRFLAIECLVFIFFLALAGFDFGVPFLNKAFYYLAFLIPLGLLFLFGKNSGIEKTTPPSFKLGKNGAVLTAALVIPTVGAVFLVSFLTSLITNAIGIKPSVTDLSGNIFLMIILHAVLPSVCEELMFRYIPISLLSGYSKKYTVVISALLFSLMHLDLASLPYAFVAGLVFAYADIAAGSILPSVILHFVNNTLSIFYTRSGGSPVFFFIIMGLGALSAIPLIIFRKRLFISLGEEKCRSSVSYQLVIVVLFAVFTILTNLIGEL